jgi:HNH endonuclease
MMNSNNSRNELSSLYRGDDIASIWQASLNLKIISHPMFGKISPNSYRARYNAKPCPFCGTRMVHGQSFYSTKSKKEAIKLVYQYIDIRGKEIINHIGKTYFHPNYVTLDHKLNKARFPEKMFDYDNLQVICWRCNHNKSDNNAFEIGQDLQYMQDLSRETLARYPSL